MSNNLGVVKEETCSYREAVKSSKTREEGERVEDWNREQVVNNWTKKGKSTLPEEQWRR
jgi:hypothetical protein